MDWDWAGSPIRLAIRTRAGHRDTDFGFNFARGGDQSGELTRKPGITLSPVSFGVQVGGALQTRHPSASQSPAGRA